MITAREQFLAMVYTSPILLSDALIVLAGEDGEERGHAAVELFRQGAGPVVVCSSGVSDPHRLAGAALAATLMGRGLAPDRLLVEGASKNTHEQAVNVLALAMANNWRTLAIVASAYHLPRAVLTFVQALVAEKRAETIRLVPVAVTHIPWYGCPAGNSCTRLALLADELDKIDAYKPHVADYDAGLAYLAFWEGKRA